MNEAQNLNKMMDYGREIGADMDEFSYALSFVTIMSKSTFMSISDALYLFTQQLSRMISEDQSQFDDLATGRAKLLALIEKEQRLAPLLDVWDTMQNLVAQDSLLRAA